MQRGEPHTMKLRKDEAGLASIAIIIIIMVILSTIVLGFSSIIRREQRRSLDRQLSSQAFYAAESGINDAVKAINDGFQEKKTDCEPFASSAGKPAVLSGNANKLNQDGSIQYSCLLIDNAPTSLIYDSIDPDKSTVFPVQTEDSSAIASIIFAWEDKDDSIDNFRPVCINKNACFDTQSTWNTTPFTGVIRADVIPGASLTRSDLLSKSRTYFMYPSVGSGSGTDVSINPGAYPVTLTYDASASGSTQQNGEIINGHCNTGNRPRNCLIKIAGINSNKAYFRVKGIYRTSSIDLIALRADGTQVRLVNAQTVVDATGRANDVIRRVQVRIPTLQDLELPENVLGSMQTLCKKFNLVPDIGVRADDSDIYCRPTP